MKILIAWGPTQEPLDPVRFISNRSTGIMGRWLVKVSRARGHKVESVQCPCDAATARDLESKLRKKLPTCRVLFMAAAVCDARPLHFSDSKIEKNRLRSIILKKNPDILAGLSKRKKKNQIFVGFALESKDIVRRGFEKLRKKGLDLIVVQSVGKGRDLPFGERAVSAWVLEAGGGVKRFESVTKRKLAGFLVRQAERLSKS